MPRTKQWTEQDWNAALTWIDRKAKTAAIFRDENATAEEKLARLADIAELADFVEAVEAVLTPEAWRRLLGALRQRKHQRQPEQDQASERKADTGTSASTERELRQRIKTLEAELSTARSKILGLQMKVDTLSAWKASQANQAAAIPKAILSSLIRLCHPDRHNGSAMANKATTWLLEQRKAS